MPLNKLPISLLRTTENPTEGAYIIWDSDSQRVTVSDTYSFQGSVSGYTSGGAATTIDKFSFSADGNATDVGDLTVSRSTGGGQSSSSSGYTAGGYNKNEIDKFPFAVDANATDVGDLSQSRDATAGQAYAVSGYVSGGRIGPPGVMVNTIDKFPFSTDSNATDVGNLTQARDSIAGQSSSSSGYTSGGNLIQPGSSLVNIIDKFPFATDANATDVGNLTVSREGAAGQSSTSHGYSSGGRNPAFPPLGYVNTIDKFPFASNANATDVGNLTVLGAYGAGQSSTVSGYTSGRGPTPVNNVIDKFPFSTDSNATDVGDLTQGRLRAAGQQI